MQHGYNSKRLAISIHALRGEGDKNTRRVLAHPTDFYPRPPWGGRRGYFYAQNRRNDISIHALRGEGDLAHYREDTSGMHFYPRPPWGGRRLCHRCCGQRGHFYPRPPWGGRRTRAPSAPGAPTISIHALRGEGDGYLVASDTVAWLFLSTPSVGRATVSSLRCCAPAANFYPRPPWGGRRYPGATYEIIKQISIHALRGEGDAETPQGVAGSRNFYPRPPWGGRQVQSRPTTTTVQFLSTPSVGRATAGGSTRRQSSGSFLSTPSVGRATAKVPKKQLHFCIKPYNRFFNIQRNFA